MKGRSFGFFIQKVGQLQYIFQMGDQSTLEFQKAVRELGLRVKHDEADQEELKYILLQILSYPNVDDAYKHHRANNMGSNDLYTKQKEMEDQFRLKKVRNFQVCSCCGILANNEELPYCTKFKDLNLGMGVNLFFKNYAFNAILFLLLFLIYSIYALITNVQSFHDNKIEMDGFMCVLEAQSDGGCGISSLGGGSKVLDQNPIKNRMSQIQSWIGLAFVIFWGFLNIIKTHYEQKYIVDTETKRVSASDFTLMIKHFPKIYLNKSYEENLEQINQIFKEYGKSVKSLVSYEVVKINIARPLYAQCEILKQKKKQVKKELFQRQQVFRNWIRYREDHLTFPLTYAQREVEYNKYIDFFTTKYDYHLNLDVPLSEKNLVFVTMRSSKAREEIADLNPPPSWNNLWNLCRKNHFPIKDVIIMKAPQPEEIKWNNVGFSFKSKVIRKCLIWMITLLLIGASIGISIGFAYINENQISQGVSVAISIVITIVNIGITLTIVLLSYYENQYISSIQQSNIAFKIGIGQLINSIGVPVIVTLIANGDNSVPNKSWLKAGGLVDDVFYIAIFNLLGPISRLIDPWEVYLKIQRCYYERPGTRLKMYGQKKLNQHYGNYDFSIGYEYAYLIKTSIFTAFFVCMQPIIACFAPIGLLLYYLVDKRNLFRHFQRPGYHSPTINYVVDFLLLFSPLAFGFGNLLVNNFLKQEDVHPQDYSNGTLIINWVNVGVAGLFLIIVPFRIFYCCIPKPTLPQLDYYEKKFLLNSDYDRLNPSTKDKAISEFENYLQELQAHQELPDQSQMIKLSMSNLRNTQRLKNQKRDNLGMSLRRSMIKSKIIPDSPGYNTDMENYRKIIDGVNQGDSSDQL